MAENPAVVAEHLWCAQGFRFVLRDLNFEVQRGEIAVIVGVNGVGKSTLIASIAGALSAAKGQVRVFGHARRRSVEAEQAARRMTVWLPDFAWLPDFMQVREYLGAAAALFDVPASEAIDRIDGLLDLFALTPAESRTLGSLSAGQKKKVGLCSALLADRGLLLLDEPFSGGLDPAGITALKRVLKHRAETRGQCILLSTPVAELVTEMADRLLVLQQGELTHHLDRTQLKSLLSGSPSPADALNALIFPDAEQRIEKYLTHSGGQVPCDSGSD